MNKVIITLVICVCIALCGCGSNTSSRASAKRDSVNVSPNVLVGVIEGGDSSYYYLVDRNTGVVYLCYNATYQHSITVMLNADGTPVTAEQLGIPY